MHTDLSQLATRAPSKKSEEALGPSSLTAWKGMGTRGCYSPLVHPIPVLVLLLCFGILWRAAAGFPQKCTVDVCWSRYETAKDSLGDGRNSGLSNESQCTALRTYLNCIMNSAKSCQGNIYFYSVRNGVQNQMKQFNCSTQGRTVDVRKSKPSRPAIPAECAYQGKKNFKHCGLFGDPHLRTFHDDFQTCIVKGAWPLVNNKYLTVQVTNDPVTGDSGATATSKLTVIIKKNSQCASETFQMYQAQTDSLPGAFYDGRTHHGEHKSVELVEVEPGKHVEIHIRYIETTIVVRQIGRYFTFAIKMPEDVVNQTIEESGLDLCLKGCPSKERINYKEFLAKRRDRLSYLLDSGSEIAMSREEAAAICRDSKLVDFYFDSCVFDLMTTGDKNFTLAALSALQDILRLDPALAKSQPNRTSFLDDDLYGNGAVSMRTTCASGFSWILLWTVLVCGLNSYKCQLV